MMITGLRLVVASRFTRYEGRFACLFWGLVALHY